MLDEKSLGTHDPFVCSKAKRGGTPSFPTQLPPLDANLLMIIARSEVKSVVRWKNKIHLSLLKSQMSIMSTQPFKFEFRTSLL